MDAGKTDSTQFSTEEIEKDIQEIKELLKNHGKKASLIVKCNKCSGTFEVSEANVHLVNNVTHHSIINL